jgi:hypothetical protein
MQLDELLGVINLGPGQEKQVQRMHEPDREGERLPMLPTASAADGRADYLGIPGHSLLHKRYHVKRQRLAHRACP